MNQQLAAILVADVQGFSKRMQDDEPRTISALKTLRDQILSPSIQRHNGQLVSNAGDGAMAIFDGCADAVRCALDIQFANNGADLKVRIGINLGDITRDGDTIHGHGVNLATRIEGLATPGGIALSSSVRNAVQGQINGNFVSLGRKRVKNIDEPIEIYALNPTEQSFLPAMNRIMRKLLIFGSGATALALIAIVGWRILPATSGIEEPELRRASPLTEKPSVAVLPIKSLSTDPGDALWSEGLTQNIVADLSKFNALFVMAADTSARFSTEIDPTGAIRDTLGVRYVITGSLQRNNEDIRLVIEVVDTNTGRNAWSDRFDFKSENLLIVQSEIAAKIAQEIGPIETGSGRLAADEFKRVAKTETEDMVAYDYFLKGVQADRARERIKARAYYRSALARDPGYSKAQARIAWTYAVQYYAGHAGVEALISAEEAAKMALKIDPDEPEAHKNLGAILLFRGRHDDAIQALRTSVELNPNGADNMMWLGWALSYTRQAEEGLTHMEKAISLNPIAPDWYSYDWAWANLVSAMQSKGEKQTGHFNRCINTLRPLHPRSAFSNLVLANCYHGVGDTQNAKIAAWAFRQKEPTYTLSKGANEPFQYRDDLEQYLESLKGIGIPE